jgi:hypothetical protein
LKITQGVNNTWQLFGKFLSYKAEGMSFQEQCDEFYAFLTECKTAAGYRAGENKLLVLMLSPFLDSCQV